MEQSDNIEVVTGLKTLSDLRNTYNDLLSSAGGGSLGVFAAAVQVACDSPAAWVSNAQRVWGSSTTTTTTTSDGSNATTPASTFFAQHDAKPSVVLLLMSLSASQLVSELEAQLSQTQAAIKTSLEREEELIKTSDDAEKKAEAQEVENEIAALSEYVKNELAEVQPALQAAKKAVSSISKRQFDEIIAFEEVPSQPIISTVRAVCTLLGEVAADASDATDDAKEWNALKAVIGAVGFLNRLSGFEAKNIGVQARKLVQERYLSNAELSNENVSLVNKACGSLMLWVEAQVRSALFLQKVAPIEKKMRELGQKLADLKKFESQVQVLRQQREKLVETVANIKFKLKRAQEGAITLKDVVRSDAVETKMQQIGSFATTDSKDSKSAANILIGATHAMVSKNGFDALIDKCISNLERARSSGSLHSSEPSESSAYFCDHVERGETSLKTSLATAAAAQGRAFLLAKLGTVRVPAGLGLYGSVAGVGAAAAASNRADYGMKSFDVGSEYYVLVSSGNNAGNDGLQAVTMVRNVFESIGAEMIAFSQWQADEMYESDADKWLERVNKGLEDIYHMLDQRIACVDTYQGLESKALMELNQIELQPSEVMVQSVKAAEARRAREATEKAKQAEEKAKRAREAASEARVARGELGAREEKNNNSNVVINELRGAETRGKDGDTVVTAGGGEKEEDAFDLVYWGGVLSLIGVCAVGGYFVIRKFFVVDDGVKGLIDKVSESSAQ